jgi:hypothetical protein
VKMETGPWRVRFFHLARAANRRVTLGTKIAVQPSRVNVMFVIRSGYQPINAFAFLASSSASARSASP